MDDTALVVVGYGDASLLERHLVRVAAQVPEVLVVVVDNRSTQEVREATRRLVDERGWLGVYPASNLGFGGGVAAGVAAAEERGRDVIVILNPDAELPRASLERLAAVARRDRAALAAPVTTRPDGSHWSSLSHVYLADGRQRSARRAAEHPGARRLPWLSGACLAFSLELWHRVGGFDPHYFLYWEDVDLSVRVERAGGRLLVVEDAACVHDEGGTSGVGRGRAAGEPKSDVYYRYSIRNRLVFAALNLDAIDRRRWAASAPAAAWRILTEGGRRQLVRRPGLVVLAARSTVEGLRLMRSLARGRTPRDPGR